VTGRCVVIAKQQRARRHIDNQEAAWSQVPRSGDKKRCVILNVFDYVEQKNSIVMPQHRRFLVADVVYKKPAFTGLRHFQSRLIQITAVHRKTAIAFQHISGDSMPASDFQRALHPAASAFERSDKHAVSPLHPKMVRSR
jgi:hypothetical protein